MGWLHWLIVHLSQETGTSNSASRAYDFWSGFGSDLGEVTLLGGLYMGWRHVNCHAPRCPRVGKHPAADGVYKLCSKHHPDVPDDGASLEHIHAAHAAAEDST